MSAKYNLDQYEFIKSAVQANIPENFRGQVSDGVCRIYHENKEKAAIMLSEFQRDINNYYFGNIAKAVQRSINSLMRDNLGYDTCCPQPRHVSDS